MYRKASEFLNKWLVSPNRKPLVIRGARQVGKTWLVRDLAKKQNKALIEINFEAKPNAANLFLSSDPKQIIQNIEVELNIQINIEESILFLDEIQACPECFAKLRWFAENMPQLAVTAAGSLLEFVLAKHEFSMPVGRISYCHLEPLTFEEFLNANNAKVLFDILSNSNLKTLSENRNAHEKLNRFFKEYIIIGGMPACVQSWVTNKDLNEISAIQYDLIATYRDDFNKYAGKVPLARLDELIMTIPRLLGQKFIYSHVNKQVQSHSIKRALDLLIKARVCNRVIATAANGIPLLAELNHKYFKITYLDTGLVSSTLGLKLSDQLSLEDLMLVNKGGVAEQVVGQMLRSTEPFYKEPALYCWSREEKTSNAEIDYIIQYNHCVIPVEVKSGSTGSLKSLHLFMSKKKYSLAVRINSDKPSMVTINTKLHDSSNVSYELLSIPFYLTGQLGRLINTFIK